VQALHDLYGATLGSAQYDTAVGFARLCLNVGHLQLVAPGQPAVVGALLPVSGYRHDPALVEAAVQSAATAELMATFCHGNSSAP
jgi:hypothetical protein